MLIEQFDQLGEVGQGAGQAVDLVDNDDVDLAGPHILQQPLQSRPVGGEFIIMQRLASGTDRGNVAAKRSDQGRHGRAVVRQIVLRECRH